MSRKFLNSRVAALSPSATLQVSEQVRQLKAQGVDVVDLGGGDPHFPTPPHICEAATLALSRGETHYVSAAGIAPLRAAIAHKLRTENRFDVSAEQVLVTPGGKAALFAAFSALLGPGDEVLLPEPAWVSYRPMIELSGATVKAVRLSPDDGFRLNASILEREVTSRTSAIVLCSPSNPTGHVLDAEELEQVADLARARDLLVFSDEIYEKVIYDGRRHVSVASLPKMAERTLVFNGFSKAYAMTGWRLGYVAGPLELINSVAKVHGHMATCAASFSQAGGLAALQGSQRCVSEMVEAYERRRNRVCEVLSSLPGVRCQRPQGAFYALADFRQSPVSSSVELARRLLQSGGVATTPGVAFGAAAEGHLRLSFATSDLELERGLERIEQFVRSL